MPQQPATDSNAQSGDGNQPPAAVHQSAAANADAPHPSDEALMTALQAGDDAALAPLMERWELGVKNFLLRLGVPDADVEDIAQEAFVRVYYKKHTFRKDARFKPWLLTIVGNLGRNRLRWRLRRREQSIDIADAGDQYPATTDRAAALSAIIDHTSLPADQLAERNSTHRAIRRAVATLPDKLRRALVCVDLEELTYAEAAAVIGCSVKAVETRLQRARSLLRERCQHVLTNPAP